MKVDPAYDIPFNRPTLVGRENEYMARAVQAGHISGDGAFTRECHTLLEKEVGVPQALLTTSCTHALEMASLLLELGPGDEVIMPSFTFVSMANAVALRGAQPVFVDVRPDTLNLDETLIEAAITKKTRAVFLVHYAGVACEMDAIQTIADRAGLPLVEDNAHGLFARYKGRQLGTFGALATLSFHETKNFTCGEGGALLVNDQRFSERAEVLREKGTNRKRFFRGEVDKYSWVDVGSSFLPSDLLAAFLLAQLEMREEIQGARGRIWNIYRDGLADWAQNNGVRLPVLPEHCDQAHHLFYLMMPSGEARQALIAHLKSRRILSVFHYQPLHLSEMGLRCGNPHDCPVSQEAGERLLRLPFYGALSDADQQRVIEAVHEFHL